jgi:DNA-binding MarR family transcriptional regulator
MTTGTSPPAAGGSQYADLAPDAHDVAAALRMSVGLLLRRMRQARPDGELTLPEAAALTRLDRGGPATPSALARQEQISPQSMGATIAALEARGLVERRPDPADGRRAVIYVTGRGQQKLTDKRNARIEQFARALSTSFSQDELARLVAAAPLIERLAQCI